MEEEDAVVKRVKVFSDAGRITGTLLYQLFQLVQPTEQPDHGIKVVQMAEHSAHIFTLFLKSLSVMQSMTKLIPFEYRYNSFLLVDWTWSNVE